MYTEPRAQINTFSSRLLYYYLFFLVYFMHTKDIYYKGNISRKIISILQCVCVCVWGGGGGGIGPWCYIKTPFGLY